MTSLIGDCIPDHMAAAACQTGSWKRNPERPTKFSLYRTKFYFFLPNLMLVESESSSSVPKIEDH